MYLMETRIIQFYNALYSSLLLKLLIPRFVVFTFLMPSTYGIQCLMAVCKVRCGNCGVGVVGGVGVGMQASHYYGKASCGQPVTYKCACVCVCVRYVCVRGCMGCVCV